MDFLANLWRKMGKSLFMGLGMAVLSNRRMIDSDPRTTNFAIVTFFALVLVTLVSRVWILYRINTLNDSTVLQLKGAKHGLQPMQIKNTSVRQYDYELNMTQVKIFLAIVALAFLFYSQMKVATPVVGFTLLMVYQLLNDPLVAIHIGGRPEEGDLKRPFGCSPVFEEAKKDTMTAIETRAQLDELLLRAKEKPVLIDFHATWCEPCRTIAPGIMRLAEEKCRSAIFAHCDVDDSDPLCKELGISAVPTFVLYRKGVLVEQWSTPDLYDVRSKLDKELEKTASVTPGATAPVGDSIK
ncbi:Thioredoxin H4 [Porphyridium purpureum]|uniref:Thioredoxin H4 n=1 Tax=Porphyridium purpureum TaxID=35688 RepID=A0A5J4YKP3_PORPP|nr:Thioredoxin H4 [Porphyridium purpureum]|eukprot:POR1260..scf210_14